MVPLTSDAWNVRVSRATSSISVMPDFQRNCRLERSEASPKAVKKYNNPSLVSMGRT